MSPLLYTLSYPVAEWQSKLNLISPWCQRERITRLAWIFNLFDVER